MRSVTDSPIRILTLEPLSSVNELLLFFWVHGRLALSAIPYFIVCLLLLWMRRNIFLREYLNILSRLFTHHMYQRIQNLSKYHHVVT